MGPLLALVLATQTAGQLAGAGDCVYVSVPAGNRVSIGEAVLAKRGKDAADSDVLMKATDDCARKNGWSVDQAVHANGSAAMRFAGDVIAVKLGHSGWSAAALDAVRARPREQVENLANTGSGGAEFELVLTAMVGADSTLAPGLQGETKENLESFVLMVKLLALSESERLKI